MDAARIMQESDADMVPVIESLFNTMLVGIVTDRDLCMAVVAAGVSPDSVTVRDCMTTELITAKPDDHLEHVAALMKDNQIRRLVIIDGEGSPQGVIAIGDLFQRGDLPKEHIADILVMASIPTSQSSGPRAAMSHHSAHP